MTADYDLHRLGWKAFQDLCVALAEERLQRPVQTFLPTSDAGRDGAFLGTWDGAGDKESTIQCKFTSDQKSNLTLSMLSDELPKAKRLAKMGLAEDYIILTNHTITGTSEIQIKIAFQAVGVGRCRVFHRDWIINRIHESGRLRMMVPRLYGLVDLTGILDGRAYQQAQLILSEMGDNLQKLVVTEAHRRSTRAIPNQAMVQPATTFGITPALIREQLEALNGSVLNLVEDEEGPFWTYRHPTVSDAFASYVAKSPELIEIYLRGAKAESIAYEVICAGIEIRGASVIVPDSLHDLLAERIANLPSHMLSSFISYRSNQAFAKRLMDLRPDICNRLSTLSRPLDEDVDVDLLTTLNKFGLLIEERRLAFVEEVRLAAIEDADDSFLEDEGIANTLTPHEKSSILDDVETEVIGKLHDHVQRLRRNWDRDYEPDSYFEALRESVYRFARALSGRVDPELIKSSTESHIRTAISWMNEDYTPESEKSTPTQQSAAKADSLDELFRDVDE